MFHHRVQSHFIPKGHDLKLWDTETSNYNAKEESDMKFDPSAFKSNDSKVSTTLCRNTSEDMISIRNLVQMQSSTPSSRSSIKLPILTTRNSIYPKDKSLVSSTKHFHSYNPSPRQGLLSPKGSVYGKMITEQSQDFINTKFQGQASPTTQKRNKIQVNLGTTKHYFAAHNARRVIKCLESDLKAHEIKFFDAMSPADNRKSIIKREEQRKIVDDLDLAVSNILSICSRALRELKEKSKLDVYLRDIIEIAKESENSELILYCFYVQAKLSIARGDFKEAINYLKQYKNICVVHQCFHNKIYAYKNLGKCYQVLMKNKAALVYFTKYLQMAWYLGSVKNELLAYDQIGLQYYYLGIPEKAGYFHNKTMSGKAEPKKSNLRQVGIERLQFGKGGKLEAQAGNQAQAMEDTYPKVNKGAEWDDGEVSSLEEVIDLSILANEDDKSSKNDLAKKELIHLGRDRKQIKKRKIENFVSGLFRAEMAKKQKDQKIGNIDLKALKLDDKTHLKSSFTGRAEKEFNKESPVSMLKFISHPKDQVLMTHLSRNRNNKNFAHIIPQHSIQYNDKSTVDLPEILGASSFVKVKLVLEKFKANLCLIKESLDICGIERQDSLYMLEK